VNELHLFAGAGGGILGGQLLGHTCVCAVEWNPYARRVLLARQRDGVLPRFPIWDDVQTFDGTPWRGRVDVVAGGFPCQDISAAGKGAGIDGERSGMWRHMARIVGEVRPRFVFVENSPILTSRGFGVVLGDLAAMGYDAEWCVLGASDAGAPHRRDRIWIMAYTSSRRRSTHELRARRDIARLCSQDVADADSTGRKEQRSAIANGAQHKAAKRGGWWGAEPDVGRVANGVAARVDRLRCIGNGQVPAVAALAWQTLMEQIQNRQGL
jgi:DNA (cytosine-5)-methyltransferase 1